MIRSLISFVVVLAAAAQADGAIFVTADVAVSGGGQYAPLAEGEFVNSNWNLLYWLDVPSFVHDGEFEFWQMEVTGFPSPADGIVSFEVLTDGPVLMAVTTRWGGGGNSSGNWIPELTTRAELEQQGWMQFATGLNDTDDNNNGQFPIQHYIVFRRDSVAGETFTYRTEKYRAPIIIRGQGIIDDTFSIVRNVQLFYNNSAFDANGAIVDADDFAAIALDKHSLGFGDAANFANISGYSRGINGVFIDVEDLPNDGAGIDAEDFTLLVGNDDFANTWTMAPAPMTVGVLPDEGENGSDRVYLTFADRTIVDSWLRVTVNANADTGLMTDHDFFFGSAPGETGAAFTPGAVAADAADLQSIALNRTPLMDIRTELITEPHDLNHDRTVDAFDLQVVALNLSISAIDLITPQMGNSSQAIGVPEPGAGAIALAAVGIILSVRAFRSHCVCSTPQLYGA